MIRHIESIVVITMILAGIGQVFAATKDNNTGPCEPPCCYTIYPRTSTSGKSVPVRKYRCYTDRPKCKRTCNLECTLGGNIGEGEPIREMRECYNKMCFGSMSICLYHDNYENDAGCDMAYGNPCGIMNCPDAEAESAQLCTGLCLAGSCRAPGIMSCPIICTMETVP